MFAVTIAVVILIVYTLLRWIDHLSKLGRVGETIDRVEQATLDAIAGRANWPFLGAAEYSAELKLLNSIPAVTGTETGYVQHIDVQALGSVAKEFDARIYVEVLPGTFVHEGMELAKVSGQATVPKA